MKKFREVKNYFMTIFDLQAGLTHEDHVISFHSIPLNTWIPSLALSLFCLTIGIFIIIRDPASWFLSVILGIASALLTIRSKHVTFSFDFNDRLLTITTRNITGLNVKQFDLNDIEKVELVETRDLQGGVSLEIYLIMVDRQAIKLFPAHLFGMKRTLKRYVFEKLSSFLPLRVDISNSRISGNMEKKVPVLERDFVHLDSNMMETI